MKTLHSLYGKKLPSSLILLLLTFGTLNVLNVNIIGVSAATYPSIYIEPSSIENEALTPGENITVSIKTNYTGNDVWSYEFSLFYNPAVLEGVQAELANGDIITAAVSPFAIFAPGEFNNNTGELSRTYAYIYYVRDVVNWPVPVASGPGTLANVTFKVVGKGNSNITLGLDAKLLVFTDVQLGEDDKYYGWGEAYTIIHREYHPDHIQDGYFDNRFQHDVAVVSVTAQAEAAVGELVSINVTVANIGNSTEVANVTVRYDSTLIGFNDTVALPKNYTDTWTGDNVTKSFGTTGKPIYWGSEKIYVNQTLMSKYANYTINYEAGKITFATAPGSGTEIKAIYLQHSTIVSFRWNTTDLAEGTYTVNATATIPVDDDPTDNWNTTTFLVAHDVAVVSITAPAEAVAAHPVSISVEVANEGSFAEVANVTVRYDSTLIGFNDTVVLPAQDSTIVPFDWDTTDLAQGNYTINATATIPEDADPNDNTETKSITLIDVHDVVVVSVTAPPKEVAGHPVPISVTVANEGSYNEDVSLTVSYDTTIINSTTFTLARGPTSNTFSCSWDTSGLANGTYTINATATVLVSAENPTGIDEDLSDNWKNTTTLLVAHDVAVVSVTAQATAAVGELVPINVTVANIGAHEEMANVTICYNSTYIDSQNVALPVGKNETALFSWNTTGVAQGDYIINATATIPVDEDPADNWNTTTILIANHDVAVNRIFVDPTSVDVGELVTIKVLVENLGWYNETFEVKVTVSYDTTLIETQTKNVTLGTKIHSLEEPSFLWNTTGVDPQSYTITAEAILDGDVNPINNRKTDSVIVELPPGAIDGTVTDASTGDPIEGANVTVNGYNATTDADGHYNITDVPPGSYTVTVSAAKHVNQSKTATVTPNATTVLDFTLTPLNGTISGTVTESSTGDPVSGASVTANGVSVSTDADGSYSIELAPGTYNVTVSTDGYESDSKSATVAAGETSIVDFELTPTPSPNIPWQLYVAIAGVATIVMVALAFYFLRIRKTKPK